MINQLKGFFKCIQQKGYTFPKFLEVNELEMWGVSTSTLYIATVPPIRAQKMYAFSTVSLIFPHTLGIWGQSAI